MELSVVITTYDRPTLLRKVLEDLAAQKSHEAYEVIVVDNAGKDDCRLLAEEFNCRYFHEEKVGHCHARNRGLYEARAAWVLYFDDDVRLPQDIITRFISFLTRVTGGAFGGRFYHWYLEPPAPWLHRQLGKGMYPGKAREFGVLPEGDYLIGCFFAVHKAKAIGVGAFDPALGMKGREVGWADETDFQLRLRNAGHEVFYAPELVIEHLMQPWKCSLRGQLNRAYSHGKMDWMPEESGRYGWWRLSLDLLRTTCVVTPVTLLRWLFRHREWYWQNAMLRIWTKYAFAYGRFYKGRSVKTQ